MATRPIRSARRAYFVLRNVRAFLRKEHELHGWPRSRADLRMLRHGFHRDKRHLYALDARGLPLPTYVGDLERLLLRRLNGPHAAFLDHKLLFSQVMRCHARVPHEHGLIRGGLLHPFTAGARPLALATALRLPAAPAGPAGPGDGALPEDAAGAGDGALPEEVVIKRIGGGGGKHVLLVERQDEEAVRVNGRETSVDALAAQLSTGTHVVSERIRQGAYAEGLYPHAVNTVRVVTMRDEQGPFLAFAVQRIGTAASTPTDNLNLGGLAAPIDRDTGVLGPAKRLEADRPATAHHHHPETGAAIAGAQVPGWDDLAGHALDLMEALPELRYVGWDLILREEGPLVLEGNSYPGVQVAQLHAPLGEDPRIARFFGRAPELAREAEHRDRASDG